MTANHRLERESTGVRQDGGFPRGLHGHPKGESTGMHSREIAS